MNSFFQLIQTEFNFELHTATDFLRIEKSKFLANLVRSNLYKSYARREFYFLCGAGGSGGGLTMVICPKILLFEID